MKAIRWDSRKDEWLRARRRIGFEEIIVKINRGEVLDIVRHYNEKRYPGQRIFVLEFSDYAYLVPFVESEKEIFLKTVIPSRKATKRYLRGG
jgi:hypothetical protein